MKTPKAFFSNPTGIFFHRFSNALSFVEYEGENLVGWYQFKVFKWYGDLSLQSWDGHQPWDFDGALFFHRFGYWWIDDVYGGGFTATEHGSKIEYHMYSDEPDSASKGGGNVSSLHDKITEAFDDDAPWRVFDLWLTLMVAEDKITLVNPAQVLERERSSNPETYNEFLEKAQALGFLRRSEEVS